MGPTGPEGWVRTDGALQHDHPLQGPAGPSGARSAVMPPLSRCPSLACSVGGYYPLPTHPYTRPWYHTRPYTTARTRPTRGY